jgi:hypothetical protein
VRVVVVVVMPVPVDVLPVEGADLHLQPHRRLRHGDHERPDVAADVEQDGALPGPGVLGLGHRRDHVVHDTADVPGSVW